MKSEREPALSGLPVVWSCTILADSGGLRFERVSMEGYDVGLFAVVVAASKERWCRRRYASGSKSYELYTNEVRGGRRGELQRRFLQGCPGCLIAN
jgi:hypothetical protein